MAQSKSPGPQVLPLEQLRWRCDPAVFQRYRKVRANRPHIIGQPRAVEAILLGMEMESPGFNVFVCGPSGTGKMSTVRALLGEGPDRRRPLHDYVYVHRFEDADRPRLIRMKAGDGARFKRQVEAFVEGLPDLLPKILDSEGVFGRRQRLVEAFEAEENVLVSDLEVQCEESGLQLAQIQIGEVAQLDIYAIHKKKPIDIEELNELVAQGKAKVPHLEELNARHAELKDALRTLLGILRKRARKLHDEVHALESKAVAEALAQTLKELEEDFPFPEVSAWIAEVRGAITDDLDVFKAVEEEEAHPEAIAELLHRLKVNVVLDNHNQSGTPVVFENFPTFTNLLGTIERPTDDTRATVDFNHVKGGSLLRANGGFLILNANDAVGEAGVWRALSRVLKTRELQIMPPEQFLGHGSITALKPESIKVDVKVIAVGDGDLYRALYAASEEFRRIFKIKADFDDVMPCTDRGLELYADHCWRVTSEEGLVTLSDPALARLAEYGVRLAEHQGEISTRFSDITDLLREASHYAQIDEDSEISVAHVERALEARRHRHALPQERLSALIERGVIALDVTGSRVGTINGLTVLDLADHCFGQPSRITARCFPGHRGVISLEREVEMSGQIHDKGVFILSSWLRARYAPDENVALSATLTFEQLYDGVEGDSASLAEALALLSALTRRPLRQDVAVTGALDPRGGIRPVGGINEKIEGFFDVCDHFGLTGEQGVVIPQSNIDQLMLKPEVVHAVSEGQFHIWAADHIDEVLALTLNEPNIGAEDGEGRFPAASFNAAVGAALLRMTEKAGPKPPGAS
ncbi:MAG: Lon protease family protein [Bradymonadia bacterium]